MERVDKWTDSKQMKLNIKKTKNIIFNFSRDKKFSTDIKLRNNVIETVSETKLLGTIITDDLKWNKNTDFIVKEANKRMQILHKASRFTNNVSDLKQIYMLQIRSKLDQSAVVWHSSLTSKNKVDLERVQKSAVKCILGKRYTSYNEGLKSLRLQSLDERREAMCLKFAKQSLKLDKFNKLFPKKVNVHDMSKRNSEAYELVKPRTTRYQFSAIPAMQRMLNRDMEKKKLVLKQISCLVPVNHNLY